MDEPMDTPDLPSESSGDEVQLSRNYKQGLNNGEESCPEPTQVSAES